MKKEAICTGKTVEDALQKAYAELGADGENSEFEIMERPKRTLFGLRVTPAKVKVVIELPDPPAPTPKPVEKKPSPRPVSRRETQEKAAVEPAHEPKPQQEKSPEPRETGPREPLSEGNAAKVECAVAYLKKIFVDMGLGTVEVKATATNDGATLTLSGEGLGVLIGRRGETLDALQYLAGLVANRLEGEYFRITIDSGNYREKREKTLEQLAKKLSGQVLKTGRNMTLEPMNPYERRIIHATVQTLEGVTSSSIGEEPNRRVVISSSEPRKKYPPKNREGTAAGSPPRPAAPNRKPGGAPSGPRRDTKPYEFRRNTNTAPITTRQNAFAQTEAPKHIDDSAFEIEPPVHNTPLPKVAPPVEKAAPKTAPEAQGKPLYSKIDLD